MELENISPESITPRPLNLGDSQDLLAETTNNLSAYKEGDDVEPNVIITKRRKKGRGNIINDYLILFNENFYKVKSKNQFLIILALIINVITLFLKLYMYIMMLYYLVIRIKKLHSFIFDRILDKVSNSYFLYIINYFFLLIGFIILLIEMFIQFDIRYKTLLTINECSLKSLILSKCFYFISLGLVPEVIFATIPFKSKKNIFLSFFKMKFLIQPYIIVITIIYILYTLCRRTEESKKERIFNEIKLIKKIINESFDNYIFVWNNFNEKINDEKEKEKNNDDEKKIELNKSVNFKKRNSEHIIRRIRKGSKDENENKTKYQKLLGNNDEEEKEDGKEKKILGFLKKIRKFKEKVSLFWNDNIFTRIKKYIILIIIGFFLCSPIINGIFGYGYYVFYESKVYRCFQIELIMCFIFGFILILLTEE